MKVVDLRADYEVGAGDVKLTIVIGNAQIGSSIVNLGDVEKGHGDIDGLIIGSGPKIRGKSLKTKSVVKDINDQSNKTVITYRLSGGKRNQSFTSSAVLDQNGDSMVYRALFRLI